MIAHEYIVLKTEDFNKVQLACNVLQMALMNLEGVKIRDLDDDPDPGALERWNPIADEAIHALNRAKWKDT